YELARRLITAQRAAMRGEYARVASIVEQTLSYSTAHGLQSSADGAWAAAHLLYLDGVANYGAVATYSDASYLGDALDRFLKALDVGAGRLPPTEPVLEACLQWLHWIVAFARQVRAPGLDAAQAGVDAYLAARGLARGRPLTAASGAPTLLWYRIDRLLPI